MSPQPLYNLKNAKSTINNIGIGIGIGFDFGIGIDYRSVISTNQLRSGSTCLLFLGARLPSNHFALGVIYIRPKGLFSNFALTIDCRRVT